MELSELKRLKALEAENARLKNIVADQALDIAALKGVLAKK
jgi:putative transposase